jgi:hypothetical protein
MCMTNFLPMLKLFVHILSKLIQILQNMISEVFILKCPKFNFSDSKSFYGKLSYFIREVLNSIVLLIIKCCVSIKIIKGAILI